MLERTLLSRNYQTLDWSPCTEYEDHAWRLEDFRRKYLIDGCCSPVNTLLSLLAYGKATVKAVGSLQARPDFLGSQPSGPTNQEYTHMDHG